MAKSKFAQIVTGDSSPTRGVFLKVENVSKEFLGLNALNKVLLLVAEVV